MPISQVTSDAYLHPKKDFGYEFHRPEARQQEKRVLKTVIIINLVGMLIEFAGGILTHSLALMSDAGHMFTHLFSLVVALIAIQIAQRAETSNMTFGYFRMEILAAFLNGLTILIIVFLILVEAFHKFLVSEPVLVSEMMGVA